MNYYGSLRIYVYDSPITYIENKFKNQLRPVSDSTRMKLYKYNEEDTDWTTGTEWTLISNGNNTNELEIFLTSYEHIIYSPIDIYDSSGNLVYDSSKNVSEPVVPPSDSNIKDSYGEVVSLTNDTLDLLFSTLRTAFSFFLNQPLIIIPIFILIVIAICFLIFGIIP